MTRAVGPVDAIRLALGVVVIVAERIRPGSPPSASIVVGLGLLEQSAAQVRALTRRGLAASARVGSRSIEQVGGPHARQAVTRSRQRLAQVAAGARRRGEATLAAARETATTFARTSARDGIDNLLPRVIDRAVPRLIDDALPEIRDRVMPMIIDDLMRDGRIRKLALSEGERAVTGAAQFLRNATAGADDRVENAVRHLRRRPTQPVGPT